MATVRKYATLPKTLLMLTDHLANSGAPGNISLTSGSHSSLLMTFIFGTQEVHALLPSGGNGGTQTYFTNTQHLVQTIFSGFTKTFGN